MKKTLKIFGILTLMVMAFVSCSKDDDPSDNDFFVGTYKGKVGYTDASDSNNNVKLTDGSVTVIKDGDGDIYNFKFSNKIPDLNGIKIEKGKNTEIKVSFGDLGTFYITKDKLDIKYTKDGKGWTANCTR